MDSESRLFWLVLIICAVPDSILGYGCDQMTVVSRAEWGARPPKSIRMLPHQPVSMAFIHHTAEHYCFDQTACSAEMRSMQIFHMDVRGWSDLGYSWVVGEDGKIYESQGWDRWGTHTYHANSVGLGISIMGNFNLRLPNQKAIDAVQNILACGVAKKKFTVDYAVYGHRDINRVINHPTECPGQMLYDLIQTWPHYDFQGPILP